MRSCMWIKAVMSIIVYKIIFDNDMTHPYSVETKILMMNVISSQRTPVATIVV